MFTKSPRHSDVVRHVALEIVNGATQSAAVDLQGLVYIKDSLLAYLQQMYGQTEAAQTDSATIQNKLAQTITYLFISLYAENWTTFFDDLLRLTYRGPESSGRDNALGIIFYLRVINSVHGEIGDVMVSRSRDEQSRANMLKDAIRERDAQKVVSSWQEILSQWQDANDLIAEMCLRAIGSWVSWTNISLIVNQSMLDLLFQQLAKTKDGNLREGGEKVRDTAVDVFTEIVGKKMKPWDKLDMIMYLNLESVVGQLSASPPLQEHRFTSKYDTDFAETVAKLVNTAAIDIVRAMESESADDATRQRASSLLESFLPHILRYFSDEYDEICSTLIPAVGDLLSYFRTMAKKNPAAISHQDSMLLSILKAVIAKMRHDETSSWDGDDDQTDEAEFQELRKRLSNLQQMISSTNEQLYIDVISELVRTTFDNLLKSGGHSDWRDLELALHEMYLFGDLAIRSGGLYAKSKPNSPAAERLVEMMLKMVEAGEAFQNTNYFSISTCPLTLLLQTYGPSRIQPRNYSIWKFASDTTAFLSITRILSQALWKVFFSSSIIL